MATKTKSRTKVRPLSDRVLVRRIEPGEEVSGGIIIPDTAKEKPMEAEVVAVGPGKRLDDGSHGEMEVSVGDTVLLGKWSGSDVKIDGEDYSIVEEKDILGIVR